GVKQDMKPAFSLRAAYPAERACWLNMINRCYSSKIGAYLNYGARGIRVCDRWRNSFAAFLDDMGPRPSSKHSIDRINNNGNYAPENCRWATNQQQGKNQRPKPRRPKSIHP